MAGLDHLLPSSAFGDRRPVSLADLALVEPGCTVFALDLNDDTDADAGNVKGGTVYAIETQRDPETGETQRRFHTATPWRGEIRFDTVLAERVRQVELVNAAAARTVIRQAAKVIATSKGATFTSFERRCATVIVELMKALG